MARFVYRLRAVLTDAREREDAALRTLARANAACVKAENELRRLAAAQTRAARQLPVLAVLRLYEDAVAAQGRRLAALRNENARVRAAVAPLRQRREALERHLARERDAHAFAQSLRDERDRDEAGAKTRLA